MYCLARYQSCATAALAAAGRTRGRAAVNSAYHARQLLTSFEAMAPWRGDEPEEPELDEPEPEPEPVPVRPVRQAKYSRGAALRQRTDDERIAEILATLRPGEWLSTCLLRDRCRLGSDHAPVLLDELVRTGRILRKKDGFRTFYSAVK